MASGTGQGWRAVLVWPARFAMQGPLQAVTQLLLLAVISLMFLPLIYVCGALVALLAMQLGLSKAVMPVIGAACLLAACTALLLGTPWAGIGLAAVVWLPVLLLGSAVGSFGALSSGLQWLMLACLLVTSGFYVILPNPISWWKGLLSHYVQSAQAEDWWRNMGLDPQKLAEGLAAYMPGSLGMGLFLGFAICLLLGRYWQAALYRPGAFGEEFRVLAFGRVPAVALGLLLLIGMMQVMAAINLAMVLLAVFMLQGLAVAHALVKARNISTWWLAALYGALMLIPQSAILVAALGASDNWMNWRVMGSGRFQG